MRAPVLHVIPFLWSGAGSVLTRLCEAQRAHGPVAVVTTSRGERPDWPGYRARLRRAGVAHYTIDFYRRSEFWTSTSRLADLIRDLNPSVVHAHAGAPCGAAVVARAMSGRRPRVIGQMYSWGPNRPQWMDRQDLWGFASTDLVVCSARAYWDKLADAGVPRSRLVYLPWGLPLDRLPFRGVRGPSATSPVVGFVGRIEPRKGQLELVRAFARVVKVMPSARLELVGPIADDAYARVVRAAIKHAGLGRAVTLTGEVRDVSAYLRRWDLFVSVSEDEGQGMAVLEAMAVGVPVAARCVAGIEDFLRDGRTGFAIDGPSPAGMASAIVRSLRAAGRGAIVRRARALVEQRYDWSRTIRAFDAIYRR